MSNPELNRERPLAIITGAVSGIGAALAELLVGRGWRLVLLNRSAERTQPLLARLRDIDPDGSFDVMEVDLTDHARLHTVAEQVVEQFGAIDALFNNAGVLSDNLVLSSNGNELQFEVNTVAPYLLTRALAPALKQAAEASGRAVVVTPATSVLKSQKALDVENLRRGVKGGLTGAYAQSKLAFAVLNTRLAEEYRDDGIECFAVDPGINRTGMTTGSGAPLPVRLLWRLLPKPSAGAARLAAMLDDEWRGQSGSLVMGGKAGPIPGGADTPQVVAALLGIITDASAEASPGAGDREDAQ
ncbi:MAG: SDR family NAD(P)-dependent oxidoreductase [Planctomycetota bacterium]